MTRTKNSKLKVQADVDRERLFDDNWRFHRDDAPGVERPDFDDASWQKLDLPHDWSLDDLPPAHLQETIPSLPVVQGAWRFKKGDDQSWKEPGLNESDWESVNLPATWEKHSNYTEDNVYGWYRRHIEVPAEFKGKDVNLLLGMIDDVDETFLNGVRIGGRGKFPPNFESAWNQERVYLAPKGLLRCDGTDIVAVRVFDGPMNGGIYDAPPEYKRVGPFDTQASPGRRDTGYVLGGIGWYRKTFTLSASDNGKLVFVRFDGVYMDSDVWINGLHLGNHPYGYTSFAYDLTPHLNPTGRRNVIVVRVRNIGHNSRWYSGSGIYRHAWLTVTDPVHVGLWGVSITTPQVKKGASTVHIAVKVENARDEKTPVSIRVRLLAPGGAATGKSEAEGIVPGKGNAVIDQSITVRNPKLWSPDAPDLYLAKIEVVVDGVVTDQTVTTFGIRTFSFHAKTGFILNGVSMKMKGACLHHDNGPLGAAAIDRAEVRRVEVMKQNGYNAIRTSHNPPSPAFLDACDRLGIIVMDETFDMWRVAKNKEDYHRFFDGWWQKDTASMVLRDRNHPSIIMWSIGNEIPERYEADGAKSAKMQADFVRALDPTRPVSSAFCGVNDLADPYLAALDLSGYNYAPDRYAVDHKRHPDRIIAATESFPLFAFDYWMGVLDNPYVVGDFVWTGMDYLGESGIGFAALEGDSAPERWPYHGAVCGDIDICGAKKPQSYYRDILWGNSKLEMAVHRPIPEGRKEWLSPWGWPDEERSWTWPGCEGKPMQVSVYSTAEEVSLSLNGELIGTKPVSRETKFTATFDVPYAAGELRAVALDGGKKKATLSFRTAGKPAKLRLTGDRGTIGAGRNNLAFITVEITDAKGQVVPCADMTVRFTVSGAGELAAVGNGDQRNAASFHAPECKTFRGSCLAILRPKGKPGMISLLAKAEGLTPAKIKVKLHS